MGIICKRGALSYVVDKNGGYVCRELKSLSEKFLGAYSGNEDFAKDIEDHIKGIGNRFELFFPSKKEHDAVPKKERAQKGRKIFGTILPSIRTQADSMDLFDNFMFWLGSWWYFNTELRQAIHLSDRGWTYANASKLVKKYILPILPEQVSEYLENAEVGNVAVGHGHFAIMFVLPDGKTRRIVTDSQLFELRGVYGYTYLDITSDGKPIARSACHRDGERGFFDGVRLMSHDQFQTCAPKTSIIGSGGYKVNSTNCTIINGMLFDLIDVDDKVAKTTGVFMGGVDFSNDDAIASYKMGDDSAKKISRKKNGKIVLNGKTFSPIGVFLPSHVKLLENGFAHYEWSDFEDLT